MTRRARVARDCSQLARSLQLYEELDMVYHAASRVGLCFKLDDGLLHGCSYKSGLLLCELCD